MDKLYEYLGIFGFAAAVSIFSYHYNKRFTEWLRFQSLGTRDYIVEKLGQMFIEISSQRILYGLIGLSFGFGSLVFILFLPKLVPAILFSVIATIIGWKIPKPLVDRMYRRRTDQVVLQMVDALSLMSNGLKSGLSVVQSMGLVTQEMPNPIQQEFSLILSENKLGVSLEDAFNNFAVRVVSDDIEMFVTSVNILKETGGNLSETFDTIVLTIRDRIKVEKKIQSMTAAGFFQGMTVLAVPPVLGLNSYLTDPDTMRPLFVTPLGWALIVIIIILEVTGFFVIMAIVKIDV